MHSPLGPPNLKTVTMLLQKLYRTSLWTGLVCLVVACTNPPPVLLPVPAAPAPAVALPPVLAESPVIAGIASRTSYATTPRDYRRDGAAHLYARNATRIFSGKMPPLLYAIGVIQVDINFSGAVTGIRWMRAPRHAPEVVAEIERAVRSAAPFPAPIKMGKVTYTDTWLWHKSGQFQLDTLTEGQL